MTEKRGVSGVPDETTAKNWMGLFQDYKISHVPVGIIQMRRFYFQFTRLPFWYVIKTVFGLRALAIQKAPAKQEPVSPG